MNDYSATPRRCPYCRHDVIEGDCVEIVDDTARQVCYCLRCERQWSDVYRFARVIEDEDNEQHRSENRYSVNSQRPAEADLRQRAIVPPERIAACTATVIGVGAIGRQVALQLAAMGVPRMQLIDPDTVEPVNLACQGYLQDDLGRRKVNATGDLCHEINHHLHLEEHCRRFRRSDEIGNVVFACVDSIETRQVIWNAVKDRVEFFCDGRMSAEVVRVLAAAGSDGHEHYPTTLFSRGEAYSGGDTCTAKSTIFTANIAAGLMLEQFSRWLRGMPIDIDVQLNLLAGELIVSE